MKISVIGTGSFGTSLAMVLFDVDMMYCSMEEIEAVVDEINTEHTNRRFLKDADLALRDRSDNRP